ncbi:peptidoglycan editing factor PgeF [Marinomonas sp. IMCC 4694]|uniref:peptidoglycan editing factor PgeF n=1 Tax=Marinomonas sp. IMCC 4694 TaxID=2605432 RepID=UPI0011E6C4D5|nr:peptidoglycan editing factor PgeF [Marinomonas sp. IMCC 4694]TYL48650.1 peptidoglycan editing factor PgeF [Marinomonas sp. IMCC 4694]
MSSDRLAYISPTWPAPVSVRAYVSTRIGGVSATPFDALNLGMHVQDEPIAVQQNRDLFSSYVNMPDSVQWLNQVHGTDVVTLPYDPLLNNAIPESADAAFTRTAQQVCAVLTADCLPVFFCDSLGSQVAVAHAGWRGLCAGVLEATLRCFDDPSSVMVWLGPAIGPTAFEVGDEVKSAFVSVSLDAQKAFAPSQQAGKWLGDLYMLATQRLQAAGVTHIYGGDHCTFTDVERFYSYRRDGQTGRMASVIWLNKG